MYPERGGYLQRAHSIAASAVPRIDESQMERLPRALAHGHLSLVYQPVVDAITGRMAYAQALIRWNDPELGPVSPADFIPVAEESGLIASLGRSCCKQCQGSWCRFATVVIPSCRSR